ncbi:MAG: fibrobacter succinogenes major paralogous domain-containing protein [Chitinophagales bacterium]|nr:fibrobacter succinogenes major paralogous domain-containing protein [Chitinophagales bacterium]
MIKKTTLFCATILTITLFTFSTCRKEPTNINQTTANEIAYTPNTQNLVGSATSEQSGDKLLYYGTWNTDNSIDKISAIVYQKSGSDTTITYQLNAACDSVAYAYFSVAGQVQNRLYTFNQLGEKEVIVNVFTYNWVTQSGSFEQDIHIKDEQVLKTNGPEQIFQPSGLFAGIPPAVTSLIDATIVTAAVVGAVGVACPPCAVTGVIIGIMIPSNSNASTNVPAPVTNNTNPTQQPQPNIPPVPNCSASNIDFTANMDAQGSIAVFGVTGGSGGYTYAVGNPPVYQPSQFFIRNYPAGTYIITVKDSSGCKRSKSIYLTTGTTVMDIDGNMYNTVQIGNQKWLKENLKVTRYNNGDTIAIYTDYAQWSGASIGAWCYYNNETQYNAPYGKLYNWYAATDSRKLCPAGWHVPSDAEFTTLRNNADPNAQKSVSGWPADPNSNPNNNSGFSALPAGQRYGFDGTFHDIGQMVVFWSSTPDGSNQSKVHYLPQSGGGQGVNGHTNGISVRCIKD